MAGKMSKGDVSFISLVERGANRIPFKVIKQEKSMNKFAGIDLGSIFGVRKAEAPAPKVVAIVSLAGEGLESITQQIEQAGFSVAHMDEQDDGSVVFKQEDGDLDLEGASVIRMSEHIAVVTKGFRPYYMDVAVAPGPEDGGKEEVSFADACAARGFYPGIRTALEVMSSKIEYLVAEAASPQDAKAAVAKLFSEASAYVTSFVDALPAKAFKLEKIEPMIAADATDDDPSGAAGAEDGGSPGAGEGVQKDENAGAVETEGHETPAGDPAPDVTTDTATKAEDKSLTAEDVARIVSDQMAVVLDGVAKKIEGAVAPVMQAVGEVTASLADVTGRIEKAEDEVAAAKEAFAGNVLLGSESDDPAAQPARKSEMGVHGRDIDTAYMNVRSRRSR
jgi:xanthosine utilization system XapX-like protein